MRRFGELEAVVMERLWERGRPALVREVVDDLREHRAVAYTTVMTVMDNLYHKGFLQREMAGRAWSYTPTASREVHTARMMRDALDAAGDQTAALALFVADMTESESQALRWLLRRRPGSRS